MACDVCESFVRYDLCYTTRGEGKKVFIEMHRNKVKAIVKANCGCRIELKNDSGFDVHGNLISLVTHFSLYGRPYPKQDESREFAHEYAPTDNLPDIPENLA